MNKFITLSHLRRVISAITNRFKSLENAIEDIEETKAESPNWNENDSTSPNYIQNRTHYRESGGYTIVVDNVWIGDTSDIYEDPITIAGTTYSYCVGSFRYTGNENIFPTGSFSDLDLAIKRTTVRINDAEYTFSCLYTDFDEKWESAMFYIYNNEYVFAIYPFMPNNYELNGAVWAVNSNIDNSQYIEIDVTLSNEIFIYPKLLNKNYLDGYLITKADGTNSEIFNGVLYLNGVPSKKATDQYGSPTDFVHMEGASGVAQLSFYLTGEAGSTSYDVTNYNSKLVYTHYMSGSELYQLNENTYTYEPTGVIVDYIEVNDSTTGSGTIEVNNTLNVTEAINGKRYCVYVPSMIAGYSAHAEGVNTVASGGPSHAEGSDTVAGAYCSHAEGSDTTASSMYSHAEGYYTTASNNSSHAEGNRTTASGLYSHAEGYRTEASGRYSHTEGYYTEASNDSSHAEGYSATASGKYSHAEGYTTTASGLYSHAEGSDAIASNSCSHAEGYTTTASGESSHAEGNRTTASGIYSHTEGNYTTASGRCSHAEGYYTTASHKSQHVFGEYNVLDASTNTASNRGTYIEIVGKGTSTNARSNARTLDWSGNEVLAGKLTVGVAPTADMDVATKKYVDDSIGSGSSSDVPSAATATPLMDGTAAVGSSSKYAKEDHVHPSDTTKANVSDVLTKTNTTSYTPSANYHPATKKYVDERTLRGTYTIGNDGTTVTLSGISIPNIYKCASTGGAVFFSYGSGTSIRDIYSLSGYGYDDELVCFRFVCVKDNIINTITTSWVHYGSSATSLTGTLSSKTLLTLDDLPVYDGSVSSS